MRALYTAIILVASSTIAEASAPKSYFCAADLATGFKWQNGHWESARFDPAPMKFLLRPIPPTVEDPLATHGVFLLGVGALQILCQPFPSVKDGSLRCGYPGMSLLFVEGTMRFEYYFGVGYAGGQNADQNYTPLMAIGKCTVLE